MAVGGGGTLKGFNSKLKTTFCELTDLSVQKAWNQNKNETGVMTTAKNAVFIGL